MKKLLFSLCAIVVTTTYVSCTEKSAPKSAGPIVFGDSSTIVTETNPEYLSSNIEDFKMIEPLPEEQKVDTNQKSDALIADSIAQAKTNQETQPAKEEKPVVQKRGGLEAPFKDAAINISGIQGKIGNIDWNKAKSAAFILTEGNVNGQKLVCDMAQIDRVQQRIQTELLLKTPSGKNIAIPGFQSSSEWQTIKGKNNQYTISGLAEGQLKYNGKFSATMLQKACQKWARKNRMNRKEETQMLKSIRNVRSANQAPCSIALRSVVWKIAGKDKAGKNIERELRIDLNN